MSKFIYSIPRATSTCGYHAYKAKQVNLNHFMKEMLYEVRYLKSSEDMILALAGQFKQLSHEPEKFR